MPIDFSMELNGRKVEVEITSTVEAEPDVGIMSAYADGFTVYDGETGMEVDLTDAEEQAVVDRSIDVLRDRGIDDYDD